MRTVIRNDRRDLAGGDPWVLSVERADTGGFERMGGKNLLRPAPGKEKKRNPEEPTPGDLDSNERGTAQYGAEVLDKQLRSPQWRIGAGNGHGAGAHLTTRLTARPGTTITLTTVF